MRDIPIVVLPLLLAACQTAGGTDTADTADTGAAFTPHDGVVGVCVTTDRADLLQPVGDAVGVVDVSGEGYTPLSVGDCYSEPSRYLDLLESDGSRWRLGWRILDDAHEDVTPEVRIEVDGPVQLHAREGCGEGCSAAFSITSSDRVYAAFNEGTWGSALQAADLPGLTVTAGAELGRAETGCGLEAFTTQVFTGDSAVVLEPYATGSVSVGGLARTAWAASARHYARMDCTDLGDSFAWALTP